MVRTNLARLAALALPVLALRVFLSGVLPGWVYDGVRRFNHHWFNPVALWLLAWCPTYYTVVRHVGRRSGRAYITPILAVSTPNGVVIPLTYGPGTDWCRNILAAGGCSIDRDGRAQALGSPVVIDVSSELGDLPLAWRGLFGLVGVRFYLRLSEVSVDTPVPPTTTLSP